MAEVFDFSAKKADRDLQARKKWEIGISQAAQTFGSDFVQLLTELPNTNRVSFLRFPLNIRGYTQGDIADPIGFIDDEATTISYNQRLAELLTEQAAQESIPRYRNMIEKKHIDSHLVLTVMAAEAIKYFVNPPTQHELVTVEVDGGVHEFDINQSARFRFWSAASGAAIERTTGGGESGRFLSYFLHTTYLTESEDVSPEVRGYMNPMNGNQLEKYLKGDQEENVINLFGPRPS
jgi:hypothetical protein